MKKATATLLLCSAKLDLTNMHCSRSMRLSVMHITKYYYFLWLHEEKHIQVPAFTSTPLVMPVPPHSTLHSVHQLQNSVPQAQNQNVSILSVTTEQKCCSSKCFRLQHSARGRSKGNPRDSAGLRLCDIVQDGCFTS